MPIDMSYSPTLRKFVCDRDFAAIYVATYAGQVAAGDVKISNGRHGIR